MEVNYLTKPAFTDDEIEMDLERTDGDLSEPLVESVSLYIKAYDLDVQTITAELIWSFSAYTPTTALTQTFTVDVIDCQAYLENKELSTDTLTVPKGAGA